MSDAFLAVAADIFSTGRSTSKTRPRGGRREGIVNQRFAVRFLPLRVELGDEESLCPFREVLGFIIRQEGGTSELRAEYNKDTGSLVLLRPPHASSVA